jgi:hypothetical protein
MVSHYGVAIGYDRSSYIAICVTIFSEHFNLTLRDIERVFGILSIYYASSQDGRVQGTDVLVTLLATMKIKLPALYTWCRNGNISAVEFYNKTRLNMADITADNFNSEWAKDMIDACVMSDTEYKDATKESEKGSLRPGLTRAAQSVRNRRRVIPYLCEQLDRFALPESK